MQKTKIKRRWKPKYFNNIIKYKQSKFPKLKGKDYDTEQCQQESHFKHADTEQLNTNDGKIYINTNPNINTPKLLY